MTISNFRWRKATDINRDYATFELLLDEQIAITLGFNDNGILELELGDGAISHNFVFSEFETLIADGVRLAEADR